MRNIKGYVFVGDFGHYSPIFGKCVNLSHGSYENITSNGITPYGLLCEAVKGAALFGKSRKDLLRTGIGLLEMQLAENPGEIELFRSKNSLVVVMINNDFVPREETLFGPIVNGKMDAYPLPGANIFNNGFRLFFNKRGSSAFEMATYLAREINRQAQAPISLGIFKLKMIKYI